MGKGIGCIANKDIREGSLVLREFPQLDLTEHMEEDLDNMDLDAVKSFLDQGVIKSFLKMSSEDQEGYMKLHNNYDIGDVDHWSGAMKKEYKAALPILATLSAISLNRAFEVWGIYRTNSFTSGVYLKMSRFNHSCQPNAEIFWNQDTRTGDLRALMKIKQGDEITICYADSDKSLWSKAERRAELKSVYNFDCNCGGCDVAEEQTQQENENVAEFKEKAAQGERVQANKRMAEDNHELRLKLIREEIDCVKQMYRLSKTIKSMRRSWILDNIVERGFNLSCSGALGEFKLGGLLESRDDQKEAWKKEARNFTGVGVKIAKTLFGEDNLRTQLWEERHKDPMKFYLTRGYQKD